MSAAVPHLVVEPAFEPRLLIRLTWILRDVTRGGLAGIVAGIVVAGIGGRLVMRYAALINPEAAFQRTENGELVGVISANGTIALLVFGGLLMGVVAGIVWAVVSPWLPFRGRVRWLLAAPITVALGGSLLIQSTNRDFTILDHDAQLVALLVGLVAAMGAAIAWLDELLDRRLPRPAPGRDALLVLYGGVTVVGLAFLVPAIELYFGNTRSPYPPDRIGQAILVLGLVTVVSWITRLSSGRLDPPPVVRTAGRIALVAAVVIGFAHLVPEIGRIIPPD